MSKTILAKVDGFTPLIDSIVQKHGILTAAVFGRVWRYCQMHNQICYASQTTIAKELGISRASVNNHLALLVSSGYLEKVNETGMPNVYKDTGKAGIGITLNAEPVNNIDTPCKKDLHPPVNNIDTKKQVKIVQETKNGNGKTPLPSVPPAKPIPPQETEMDVKEYQERIAQKLCAPPPMEANGLNVLHVEHYPADVQKPIILFCQLWNIRPPAGKGKKPGSPSADWIEGARELIDACGEIGVERVLREYRKQVEAYAAEHGGCHPFSVNSPRSLAKTAKGIAGQLREKAEREKAAPVMTSQGGFW